MKKVIAFGTFDKVHPGHINFLEQARKYGDLIVVIARDKNAELVKGRKPKYSEEERKKGVENLKLAKQVLLGALDDKYKVIEDVKPDIIALGYDQNSFTKNLEEELKKKNIKAKIVRLKPYKEDKYKSSKLNSR